MEIQTLRDLFIHELKDLYSAETQLVKALPKVAKAAKNPALKNGLLAHLEETKEHVTRLEKILSGMGTSTRGPKCKGMQGLIEEGSLLIEEKPDPEVLDAGIICGAQRIEHYEIAGYGCARTFAELLDEGEAEGLLRTTLEEEKVTDEKLSELALSSINVRAAEQEGEEGGRDKEGSRKPARKATKRK